MHSLYATGLARGEGKSEFFLSSNNVVSIPRKENLGVKSRNSKDLEESVG